MTNSLLPTYSRTALRFERGEGSWLISETGQRYLDIGAGIGVVTLGHAHPALNQALSAQAAKIWHCSNLYQVPGQEQLADNFCAATFAERVFFTNSGTEACELAVKMARKYWHDKGQTSRSEIIGLEGAFHGRSAAGIAAAGSDGALTKGFKPFLPGFVQIPYDSIDALKAALSEKTAAIILEPIQGEGGIRPLELAYLKEAEALCRESGALLILDEVQSGMGRTGRLFAHEWAEITPDIMMVAKGIGGGFPLGALLASAQAAKPMGPGTHGSTYGGNPLAMAVGAKILEIINDSKFLAEVERKAALFHAHLKSLIRTYPDVFSSFRGKGLMLGIQCRLPVADFVKAGYEARVLTVPAKDNTVRLLPPLTISSDEISIAFERLGAAAKTCRKKSA